MVIALAQKLGHLIGKENGTVKRKRISTSLLVLIELIRLGSK